MSFNIHSILTNKYYTITSNTVETYRVQTSSATKVVGVQIPNVHGVDKAVNPNFQTEEQVKKEAMPKAISELSTQLQTASPVHPIRRPKMEQKRVCHTR